jgi:hypothetical protein
VDIGVKSEKWYAPGIVCVKSICKVNTTSSTVSHREHTIDLFSLEQG